MRAGILAVVAVLCVSARADAFCGFYVGGAGAKLFNNATEVVLMRHGTTTVLSMQNNYQGPPEKFAMVVPVPVVIKEAQVKTLPREVFDKVDVLGAPRLVEYWEADPCAPDYDDGDVTKKMVMDEEEDASGEAAPPEKYKVKIEAKFSVGEYDIVVLSAGESTGLEKWLRASKYEIPAGAEPLLRPYVEQGMKFFVAKVDPKKVKFANGMATLSPLRFYYDSPEFTLPVRLGLANSAGTQDLIVNILAPDQRYEVANHPNVTIPTNLIVKDAVRTKFGEFYAALFDDTLAQVPNAVVTEYSWDSGSCDPCPGPTLDGSDLATLGTDVMENLYQSGGASYTLTRLHARYGKDLKDDLVFRAVKPIVGGRGVPDAKGEVSMKVDADSSNNFQGRYIIEHPWTGPIACASPMRGRWGAPPNGQQQIATPATNTAFAPRGQAQLASFTDATPHSAAMTSGGSEVPIPARAAAKGCGCDAEGGGGPAAAGVLLVGAIVLRRRKRV